MCGKAELCRRDMYIPSAPTASEDVSIALMPPSLCSGYRAYGSHKYLKMERGRANFLSGTQIVTHLVLEWHDALRHLGSSRHRGSAGSTEHRVPKLGGRGGASLPSPSVGSCRRLACHLAPSKFQYQNKCCLTPSFSLSSLPRLSHCQLPVTQVQ